MGPLPKRRHSSKRQAQRTRALTRPSVALVSCPQCQGLRRPHRVCPHCGYYDGKAVVVKQEKKTK